MILYYEINHCYQFLACTFFFRNNSVQVLLMKKFLLILKCFSFDLFIAIKNDAMAQQCLEVLFYLQYTELIHCLRSAYCFLREINLNLTFFNK